MSSSDLLGHLHASTQKHTDTYHIIYFNLDLTEKKKENSNNQMDWIIQNRSPIHLQESKKEEEEE